MARKKTGSIQRRGDAWRISYYANGKRNWETFGNEEVALRELARRLADASSGIPVSSSPNTVLFGELCADVDNEYVMNARKSLASLRARMENHIVPAFGLRKASSITTAQISAYVVQRKSEQFHGRETKLATINRELEVIRHVFRLALQGGKLLYAPHVPQLKLNNVRKGFLSAADVDRLCSHLKPVYALFVQFAFVTGWRRGEISSLRWTNIDFAAREIRLDAGTTKSGEGRVFPITADLLTILRSAKSTTSHRTKTTKVKKPRVPTKITPHVFQIDGRPVGEFRAAWLTANHKAGLPCVYDSETGKLPIKAIRIFHDLRRSAVRRLLQGGLSQQAIMNLCGWETASMFSRYTILTTDDLREALERMENEFGAESGAKGGGS